MPLCRAIIARSIAVAMKPHGGKISALIPPSPARALWLEMHPLPTNGQNGQRSSKLPLGYHATSAPAMRAAISGSRADHGNRRLTLRWMNELKRDAARFAIDCEIGIER